MIETKPKILLIGRCLIKNKNEEILFVQRELNTSWAPGMWEFPGGKVEDGQNLTEAAEREVMEETGLKVKVTSPICYFESHFAKGKKYEGIPLVLLIELAELMEGSISLSNEHQSYKWLDKTSALELELTDDTREALMALVK